jgi:hypothetical protein
LTRPCLTRYPDVTIDAILQKTVAEPITFGKETCHAE